MADSIKDFDPAEYLKGLEKKLETPDTPKEEFDPNEYLKSLEAGERQPKKPEDVGILEGTLAAFKRGVGGFGEVGSGIGVAGSSMFGTDDETKQKMQAIKEQQGQPEELPQLSADDISRIYNEKGLFAAAAQVPKYITENFAASAPEMSTPLAAGEAVGRLNPELGALVGIGVYGVQQFGHFMVDQAITKDDPKDLEVAKAALAATGTAPLGYYADKFTAGLTELPEKEAAHEIIKELTARQRAAALGKRVAVGSVEGVIAEAPVEVLEQAAELWQNGQSLTDEEAQRQYREAFFGAASVGGFAGAVSRGLRAPKGAVEPTTPEPTLPEPTVQPEPVTPPITPPTEPTPTPPVEPTTPPTETSEEPPKPPEAPPKPPEEPPKPPIDSLQKPGIPLELAPGEKINPNLYEITKPKEQISKEVTGMSVPEISSWAVQNAPNEFAKEIAKKVEARIKDFQKIGVPMTLEVKHGADRVGRSLGHVIPRTGMEARGGTTSYEMVLKGLDKNGRADPRTGTDYSTVLHELLHVSTIAQLGRLGQQGGTGYKSPAFEELKGILNKARQQYRKDQLLSREQGRHLAVDRMMRGAQYLKDTDELVSYGFTDPVFQHYLSTVKMGNKSAFHRFVEIVQKLLGIKRDYHSALDALVKATDTIYSPSAKEIAVEMNKKGYNFGKPKVITTPVKAAQNATIEEEAKTNTKLPEKMSWGIGGVHKTTPINKPSLWHETNGYNAADLIQEDLQGTRTTNRFFLTDNKDLALGQHGNTGVTLEYDGYNVSGKEHKKPMTGDLAGREYIADGIAKDSIKSIHVEKGVKLPLKNLVARELKNKFDIVTNPDGSMTMTRKSATIVEPTKYNQNTGLIKTETPEFKKWFGNSKVVDDNGKPLVMYHGAVDFEETDGKSIFKPTKKLNRAGNPDGYYFTKDPEEASSYTTDLEYVADRLKNPEKYDKNQPIPYAQTAEVIPAYLSIKNPFVKGSKVTPEMLRVYQEEVEKQNAHLGERAKEYAKDKTEIMKERGASGRSNAIEIFPNISFSTSAMQRVLKAGEYDGFQDGGNHWIVFDSNQIKSAIGNSGAYSEHIDDIRFNTYQGSSQEDNWHGPTESKVDNLIYRLQDKHIDTKRVQQAIEQTGKKIEDEWNVYLKEELYHGRTSSAIRKFLLQDVLPTVKEMSRLGISPDELKTYLHNLHAEERNAQIAKINPEMPDKGSGIATQDARDYLAKLDPTKRAKLDQVAKKFQDMVKGTQDVLINSGAESKKTINSWNKTYKNYVPLFRVDDDFAAHPSQGTGQGLSSRGGFSKRAMGSEKGVQDILGNIIAQRERALIRAEKIRVGRAMYGLAMANPNPEFWLPVNPNELGSDSVIQQVTSQLNKLGLNGSEIVGDLKEPTNRYIYRDPNTGLETVAYKVNPLERYKDHVFPIRVDGEDRYIFFNNSDPRAKRMVEAMKNLDAEQLGYVEGMVAKATRWFAAVNTQYNPVFGAINFLRDYQGAMFNLSSTPIADMKGQVASDTFGAMSGINKTIRAERQGKALTDAEIAALPKDDWRRLWSQFKEDGGQTLYRDSLSRKAEEEQIIEQELKNIKGGNVAKKMFRAAADMLSDFNDTIENGVRLSAYKAALDKGLSREQAASIAKNLTVNFDRKGQLGSRLNSLYAFFNASVQGSARLGQLLVTRTPEGKYKLSGAGKKIIAGGVMIGVAQALAMAAAGFDEDEPPEFVKERNLIIPVGGKNYLTIPLSLGLHIFPNIGRITTEFMLNGGKDPSKHSTDMLSTVMDAFNPLGGSGSALDMITPSILDPYVAIKQNTDAFGRPIYRKDQATNPTPGYTRSRDTASAISQELAKFLNYASGGTEFQKGAISPTADEIDYLAGQFTGGIGREALKTEQAVKSVISGEELPAYRRPLVGRFYGEAESPAADSQRFYTNVTRMAGHENEIKGRLKNQQEIGSYLRANPEARLYELANSAENQISQLNKQRKDFIARGFPPERIQQIDKQKQVIMKRFNDQVKAIQQ